MEHTQTVTQVARMETEHWDEVLSIDTQYVVPVSPEEQLDAKALLADATMRKLNMQAELKEIAKDYKERIKVEDEQVGKFHEMIRAGVKRVNGRLFGKINRENRTMEYFDADGVLVPSRTRPLTSQEKQSLFTYQQAQ